MQVIFWASIPAPVLLKDPGIDMVLIFPSPSMISDCNGKSQRHPVILNVFEKE